MDFPELRTAVLSDILVTAVCAAAIAFVWLRNRRRFAGLGRWAAGYFMFLAAVLAISLRGIAPDVLFITTSYAFYIGASISLFIGLERFLDQRGPQIHNLAILVAATLLNVYFISAYPETKAQIAVVSAALSLIFSQGAWLVFRRADPEMRSIARGVGVMFTIAGLINLGRVFVFLTVSSGNEFFRSTAYEALQLMLSEMILVAFTFSMLLMVNRRLILDRELELANREKAEESKRKSESRYLSLFENMLEGYAHCKMIYDEAGSSLDFVYLHVNDAFEEQTGLKDVIGRRITELIPGIRASNPELFEIYGRVAATGVSARFETRLDSLAETWFSISAFSPERGYFVAVFENITEQKRAVANLERREEGFRQMITSSADAIVVVNTEGAIVLANPRASSLFGYGMEELIGANLEMLVPQRFHSLHTFQRAEYAADPHPRPSGSRRELSAVRKDGSEFPVDISLSYLKTQAGLLITADIRDVTERKAMENALRSRNEALDTLQQTMLDLVNRHDVEDILQTRLPKIGSLLQAQHVSIDLIEEPDTLVTHAVTPGQPLQKGDRMRRGEGGWLSWQAIETGEPAVMEDYSRWARRRELYDGFPIHAIAIVPIHQRERVIGAINFSREQPDKPFNETEIYAAQQLAQMVSLVLDNAAVYSQLQSQLAESVQREATLHEAQAQVIEQQRSMAAIDERQRMARDLHDSVNQSIHSLVLFTETLVASLDKQNLTRARQISERLQESARQALKETRLLLYQTQTQVEERGVNLVEELNARLESVEARAGVRAQLQVEGSLENCPEAWRENLFWITIEALNNSLKHAQARSVEVILRFDPSFVELEIADDGRGFDANMPDPGGYGLRNMRGRAERLGGALTLTSAPDQGARVLFRAEIQR